MSCSLAPAGQDAQSRAHNGLGAVFLWLLQLGGLICRAMELCPFPWTTPPAAWLPHGYGPPGWPAASRPERHSPDLEARLACTISKPPIQLLGKFKATQSLSETRSQIKRNNSGLQELSVSNFSLLEQDGVHTPSVWGTSVHADAPYCPLQRLCGSHHHRPTDGDLREQKPTRTRQLLDMTRAGRSLA